jgi:hypothetical protein
VIRNVVIHITNEQPLLADLYEMPTVSDVNLICTNLRMLDGKKPIFIDYQDSVFAFPLLTIRFIEIRSDVATGMPETPFEERDVAGAPDSAEADADEPDLELDEDFLRRIRDV